MSSSARRYSIHPPSNSITAHDRTSIYTSAPFKFIIDGKPLYIHAELVSQNSKPLDRMINGYMSEAQEGFAVIKDVDEGTFVRFIQWAYTGYYEAGKFKIDPPRADSALSNEKSGGESDSEKLAPTAEVSDREDQSEEHVVDDSSDRGWDYPRSKEDGIEVDFIDTDTSSTLRRVLKESFITRNPSVRKEAISISPPRHNQAPNENYTDVFLSHARVYVFAEKYDIQSLKALALDELHCTLQSFDLHPERTGDIIALLRYVYANTGEIVDGVEDMRTVLKDYVGFEMDILMKDEDFGHVIIEDGGALLRDFLKMVEQRIG